jgi:hypothetical protein
MHGREKHHQSHKAWETMQNILQLCSVGFVSHYYPCGFNPTYLKVVGALDNPTR